MKKVLCIHLSLISLFMRQLLALKYFICLLIVRLIMPFQMVVSEDDAVNNRLRSNPYEGILAWFCPGMVNIGPALRDEKWFRGPWWARYPHCSHFFSASLWKAGLLKDTAPGGIWQNFFDYFEFLPREFPTSSCAKTKRIIMTVLPIRVYKESDSKFGSS